MIIERALTEEERTLLNDSIKSKSKWIRKHINWFIILILILLPIFFIPNTGAVETPFIINATVYFTFIALYFFIVFRPIFTSLYYSSKSYEYLLKEDKVLYITTTCSQLSSFIYNKKEDPAFIFQISTSTLLLLSSDYFSDEENIPSKNITVTFFQNRYGKNDLFRVESSGDSLDITGEINGILKSSLKLNNKYTDPYEFSIFEGSLNEPQLFVK